MKQLRYKARHFEKALKAGASPPEGTAGLKVTKLCHGGKADRVQPRRQEKALGTPLWRGCALAQVSLCSLLAWAGPTVPGPRRDVPAQPSTLLWPGASEEAHALSTYPAAPQHKPQTSPCSCFPKWLWKDPVLLLHKSLPPCWPSCPPHSGLCRITKFTAVELRAPSSRPSQGCVTVSPHPPL